MGKDRDSRAVRIALPWLQQALHFARDADQEPALPALQWLATRAVHRRRVAVSWREWLFGDVDPAGQVLARFPAGPCVRAACDPMPPQGVWAVAQPVHLATAIDHLRLAPFRNLAIEPGEADALLATANGHLAGTGFALSRGAADCWVLRCPERIESTTVEPDAVVGQNVRDFLPTGRDGPALCSLMNELQMVLHEHPINERRQRRGQPPINSLWLWGIGSAESQPTAVLPPLCCDDPWLSGLWRLHGASAAGIDQVLTSLERPVAGQWVAACRPDAADDHAALAAADHGLLAAAAAAVAAGRCSNLRVLAGEAELDLDALSRWRFWRRRVPMASFDA